MIKRARGGRIPGRRIIVRGGPAAGSRTPAPWL